MTLVLLIIGIPENVIRCVGGLDMCALRRCCRVCRGRRIVALGCIQIIGARLVGQARWLKLGCESVDV
jgi:hypothetical protein